MGDAPAVDPMQAVMAAITNLAESITALCNEHSVRFERLERRKAEATSLSNEPYQYYKEPKPPDVPPPRAPDPMSQDLLLKRNQAEHIKPQNEERGLKNQETKNVVYQHVNVEYKAEKPPIPKLTSTLALTQARDIPFTSLIQHLFPEKSENSQDAIVLRTKTLQEGEYDVSIKSYTTEPVKIWSIGAKPDDAKLVAEELGGFVAVFEEAEEYISKHHRSDHQKETSKSSLVHYNSPFNQGELPNHFISTLEPIKETSDIHGASISFNHPLLFSEDIKLSKPPDEVNSRAQTSQTKGKSSKPPNQAIGALLESYMESSDLYHMNSFYSPSLTTTEAYKSHSIPEQANTRPIISDVKGNYIKERLSSFEDHHSYPIKTKDQRPSLSVNLDPTSSLEDPERPSLTEYHRLVP